MSKALLNVFLPASKARIRAQLAAKPSRSTPHTTNGASQRRHITTCRSPQQPLHRPTASQPRPLLLPSSRRTKIYRGARPSQTTPAARPPERKLTAPFIHLRAPGSNDVPPPVSTRDVLASLNHTKNALKVVYWPPTPENEDDLGPDAERTPIDPNAPKWPIAIVVNKREEAAKEAEKAAEKRLSNVRTKEMELNWAIDRGDLDVKMKRMRAWLEKGLRVQLMLMNKHKGVKKATMPEAKALLKRVENVVEEVGGSREYKTREGEMLQVLRIFLDGPAQKLKEKMVNKGPRKKQVRDLREDEDLEEAPSGEPMRATA